MKYKRYANTIITPLLITFLVILIIFFSVIICYFINIVFELKNDIISIESTINNISGMENSNSIDKTYINIFSELSNHANAEMDRLISIVGIIAAVYTIFGALIVFKAPYEIDKRITKLNEYMLQASAAAEEAKYQAKVLDVIVRGNDGDLTSFSKIRRMTEIIEEYPDRRDAYMERGFLYDNMKRYDEAINDYLIALKLSGEKNASCFNDIAVAYSKKGDEQKALKYYSKAIKIDANDSVYYTNRGVSYAELGEYQKALEDYEKAIQIDSKNKDAFKNRSTTYWYLMKKEKDEIKRNEYYQLMVNDLKSSLELDPEDRVARQFLVQRLNSNVNVEVMLAEVDEKIGDLELEEKHLYEGFKQYSEAILYYLEAEAEENKEYLADIERLIIKIYNICDGKLFSQIDDDDKILMDFAIALHEISMRFYYVGNKSSAEKSLLILYHFNNKREIAAINLAYMKRRHETELTTQSVKELLTEYSNVQDGLWCVNTALCYVYGIDGYKMDWKEAIAILNFAEDTIDAILWWSNSEIVGEQEHNIAMILFHLSDKFDIEDDVKIEDRISKAADDGFCIPSELT